MKKFEEDYVAQNKNSKVLRSKQLKVRKGAEGKRLMLMQVLQRLKVKLTNHLRDQLDRYGHEELEKLIDVFSPLLSEDERNNAADEWVDLKCC